MCWGREADYCRTYMGDVVDVLESSGRLEQQATCVDWIRDVSRVLILPVFVAQMVLYDGFGYWEYASENTMRPLFFTLDALVLLMFLFMMVDWHRYAYAMAWALEELWKREPLTLLTPLAPRSSSFIWHDVTAGKSLIPYYGCWVLYISASVIPRNVWMLMTASNVDTTTDDDIILVPPSFTACIFLINACINVAYLYEVDTPAGTNSARALYLVLHGTSKSVIDVLDAEAFIDEAFGVQERFGVLNYLVLAFVVLTSASAHLLLITLYVHLRTSELWNYESLEAMLGAVSKKTRDYGRATVLFFVSILLMDITADLIKFLVRILLAVARMRSLSTFIYKNAYYSSMHGLQVYSLMLLLASYRESNVTSNTTT
eukprot:scpid67916/ scgid35548/ 